MTTVISQPPPFVENALAPSAVSAAVPSDPPSPPEQPAPDTAAPTQSSDIAADLADNLQNDESASTDPFLFSIKMEDDDAQFAFKLAMSFRQEDHGLRTRRKPKPVVVEPPVQARATRKRKGAGRHDLDEEAAEGLVALVFGEASEEEEAGASKATTAPKKKSKKQAKGKAKLKSGHPQSSQSKRTVAQFAKRCNPDDCKIDHFERCTNVDADRNRCRNKRTKRTRCSLHLGGKKCLEPGCTKFAVGGFNHCIGHGGGRRCRVPGCEKHARGGGAGLCGEHGGGRACEYKLAKCSSKAISGSTLCKSHGGGKRCMYKDCDKSAQGATPLCVAHGGGRRCAIRGCKTAAVPPSKDRCLTHGGGRRCQQPGCAKPARSPYMLCMRHWKRCGVEECKLHAIDKGLCRIHCVEDIPGKVTV